MQFLLLLVLIFGICEVYADVIQAPASTKAENANDAPQRQLSFKLLKLLKGLPLSPPLLQLPPIVVYRPVPMQHIAQRTEVQGVVQEITCAPELVLKNSACEGVQVLPPTIACPPGSSLTEGRCMRLARMALSCPEGFHLGPNQRCVRSRIIPAQLTCREGETLHHSGSACMSSVPSPPQCLPGFALIGSKCVQRVRVSFDCPPGYVMLFIRRQCVQNSVHEMSIVCPEGFLFNRARRRCIALQHLPPRCPRMFKFDPDVQQCVQLVPEVPAPCPNGFTSNGQCCENIVVRPAVLYCPSEYILENDGQCMKSIDSPPVCPAGYVHSRLELMQCEKLVPEVPVCPDDTITTSPGQCQKRLMHDSIECCPSGFTNEGKICVRSEFHSVTFSCQQNCFNVRSIPTAFACSSNADFVDDPIAPKCVHRTVTQRCAPPQPLPRQCEDNVASELRSLASAEDLGRCVKQPVTCEDVRQENIMLAEPYCPDGGIFEEDHCVIKEPIIPEPICEIGVYQPETQQCLEIARSPVSIECPPGTVREGHICYSVETVSPNFICPPGAEAREDGTCTMSAPAQQPPVIITKAPALMSCPDGEQLSKNENCVTRHVVPLMMVCPPGTSSSGKGCVATAELIISPPIEKAVRASHVCPQGTFLRNFKCHVVSVVPAMPICPPETVHDEVARDSCVRLLEPVIPVPRVITTVAVPICPLGTVSRGSCCIETEEVEPMAICPDEFEVLDGNKCVTFFPPTILCPEGMTQGPEGCSRLIVTQPIVTVVQGCVHQIPCDQCEIVQPTCHQL